jgi:hypothetical protein
MPSLLERSKGGRENPVITLTLRDDEVLRYHLPLIFADRGQFQGMVENLGLTGDSKAGEAEVV